MSCYANGNAQFLGTCREMFRSLYILATVFESGPRSVFVARPVFESFQCLYYEPNEFGDA